MVRRLNRRERALKAVQQLDAFPKHEESVQEKTSSGGTGEASFGGKKTCNGVFLPLSFHSDLHAHHDISRLRVPLLSPLGVRLRLRRRHRFGRVIDFCDTKKRDFITKFVY